MKFPQIFRLPTKLFLLFFLLDLLSTWGTACAWQNDPPAQDTRSALAVRQRLIEQKMNELESKLTTIAERLKEKEPERAGRLITAYQASKESLITRRMADVSQLLDQNKLVQAGQTLDEVIANLDALLKILVDRNEPEMSKQEEIQMLERWKKEINDQIRDQQQQRQETEKVTKKEETLETLEAQIKKVKELIDRQNAVTRQTEVNQNANLRTLDRIADEQFEVRKQTQDLLAEIKAEGGESETGQSEFTPSESTPSDPSIPTSPTGRPGQSDQVKQTDQKGQGEQADQTADQTQDGQAQTGDDQQSESKSGQEGTQQQTDSKDQQQASEGQGSQSTPAGDQSAAPPGQTDEPKRQQPPAPPQPGQQPLQRAMESQERAEEKLGSGKSKDAQRQQEQAERELENALQELEREKRRIESLPPEALQQMADEQRRTRDKAMKLLEEMQEAPTGADPQQSPEDDDGSSQPQPGQEAMEQAGDAMQQASDNLQNQDGQQAEQDQRKAVEKMNDALDEIEERLNQLRDETREEKLARLESRFQEMLQRQIVASTMTIELHEKQRLQGELRRRDRLALLQLAGEESEISELGQQAYDILLEDGTSIVFPEIIQELRGDLARVADLLQEERTDSIAQLIQKEIEITIQDLLDALQEAQGEPSEGGGGGGGGGDQPLLKKSAELKIMRMHQVRLNRRAKQIQRISQGNELDQRLQSEASEAAQMQQRLVEMLEEILQKEGQ